MARKKGKRTGRIVNVADLLVGTNVLVQMLEPFVTRGFLAAAQQALETRDLAPVLAVLKEGSKEAISVANIMQSVGPAIALKVIRMLVGHSKAIQKPKGRITGVRAY